MKKTARNLLSDFETTDTTLVVTHSKEDKRKVLILSKVTKVYVLARIKHAKKLSSFFFSQSNLSAN